MIERLTPSAFVNNFMLPNLTQKFGDVLARVREEHPVARVSSFSLANALYAHLAHRPDVWTPGVSWCVTLVDREHETVRGEHVLQALRLWLHFTKFLMPTVWERKATEVHGITSVALRDELAAKSILVCDGCLRYTGVTL